MGGVVVACTNESFLVFLRFATSGVIAGTPKPLSWLNESLVHFRKLTCPLKKDYFNRKYIFQHVSFPGSNFQPFPTKKALASTSK